MSVTTKATPFDLFNVNKGLSANFHGLMDALEHYSPVDAANFNELVWHNISIDMPHGDGKMPAMANIVQDALLFCLKCAIDEHIVERLRAKGITANRNIVEQQSYYYVDLNDSYIQVGFSAPTNKAEVVREVESIIHYYINEEAEA